jgi:site-specific DNA-methyltransferase (adenine-specific)
MTTEARSDSTLTPRTAFIEQPSGSMHGEFVDWPPVNGRPAAGVGDALELLRSLPTNCTAAGFFDPQHRDNLDQLKYGNEGARQRERHTLPAMPRVFIDECCREIARVLRPTGYLFLWTNTFQLGNGNHLHLRNVLFCVDIIAWDNKRPSMGYRARRQGDYLLVLQKPPLKARATWQDHTIWDRWREKVDRNIHPHVKPAGLIGKLIASVTRPGDIVIDPAAGSFIVKHAAHRLGRQFVGCDIRGEAPTPPDISEILDKMIALLPPAARCELEET